MASGGGGAGTVIEPACSSEASWGACTPPSCPVGWTDAGTISFQMTAGNVAGVWGKYSRYCSTTTTYKLIEPACSNAGGFGCVPPVCPIGWTDLNIISIYGSAASNGGVFRKDYRHCIK
ncbi:MAG: hypothetical protein M1300_07475 [Epsilonproteobacteria bacterium]|nr:hypothetical protein [Campylobacterota bacterium]